MATIKASSDERSIPLFGARKMARALLTEIAELEAQRDQCNERLARLGALSVIELEAKRIELEREITE